MKQERKTMNVAWPVEDATEKNMKTHNNKIYRKKKINIFRYEKEMAGKEKKRNKE